jgi:hypothetical protein
MPQCAICLQREATQTGSHLLSAFMIESVVGKRGHEKGYLLDDEPDFDYRRNTGAAPVLEDYMFCTGCEQRMAYVEGYICSEYRDKLKNTRFEQNFSDSQVAGQPGLLREAGRVHPHAFTLLLVSLLYRMSLSHKKLFAGFELTPPEQEQLRVILDAALPPYDNFKAKIKIAHYLRTLDNKAELFGGLYYIVATYDQLPDETMSFNLVHPGYRLPYNMMFGQLLVLFFFGKPRRQARYLDFFGLFAQWDVLTPLNGEGGSLKTIILPEQNWQGMLTNVRDEIVAQKIPGLMQLFLQEHYQAYQRPPTNEDWLAFLDRNFPPDQMPGSAPVAQ